MHVLKKQEIAWNKGDLEGYMKGYWKSKDLQFIGGRGVSKGWQTTLDNYRATYPDKNAMGELHFSDLQIQMLGKQYASVLGRWKLVRERDEPQGYFTLIFQKFQDGWKITSDHTQLTRVQD